jgi:P27 family predicted phage terminase small subunit
MIPGSKPMPTCLATYYGNPGKRPLNEREPEPERGFPPCPERLQGKAREAWERFSKELAACGVGAQLDATALELLCEAYAAHVEAAAQIARNGPVWVERQEPGKLPKFAYSPFWVIQKNEHKKLLALLAEFGMTPSSPLARPVQAIPYSLQGDRPLRVLDRRQSFLSHAAAVRWLTCGTWRARSNW